jgi:hypothetical protein
MALTSLAATLVRSLGAYSDIAYGVAGGSGTSTVVRVPSMSTVSGAIVGGATSSTAPYCDTVSGNTFTVTHATSDKFAYIVFGKAKI